MTTSELSPVSVVAALRQSRKGKLSYDRYWTERNTSVERVLKEVTHRDEALASAAEFESQNLSLTNNENRSPTTTTVTDSITISSQRYKIVFM